ncbi:hypothetical protein [Bacillus bombysepticus]|uniref:hypothetical protein n=1 Tax=Bacillus bombysepticus TaxID=658666 RepID=UPI00207AB1C7|nr:hypothetical protein [Bacillus bombysepticus]USL11122.1 hypothetical protein LIT24_29460 [Bacillus bombysepticus]
MSRICIKKMFLLEMILIKKKILSTEINEIESNLEKKDIQLGNEKSEIENKEKELQGKIKSLSPKEQELYNKMNELKDLEEEHQAQAH